MKNFILNGCPTLRDMANAYYGMYTIKTAVKHFKEEIDNDEELSRYLQKARYVKWHQHFTPQQAQVIFEYWGPPNALEEWMKNQKEE